MSARAAALVALAVGAVASCTRPARTEPPPERAVTPVVAAAPAPAPEAPPTAADVPPAAPVATSWERFVPELDAATAAHVRAVFARGAAAGLRSDVFSKLGDSITESGSFAQDIGHGWFELGAFTDLEPVVRWFRRRALGGRDDNAFTRASAAATAGWESSQLLEGGDRCPVERELHATRGAFAVLMIGTNDAERASPAALATHLGEILDRVERRGVVALVSTIPSHRGAPAAHAAAEAINQRIRAIAAERHIPLIDYHAALAALPSEGISGDDVHPSVYVSNGDTRAAVFTPEGLRYGYNVRNLLLLIGLGRALDATGVPYTSTRSR